MTSTDLEISNLKRQIEIQNSILEQILSEMKKNNELREKQIKIVEKMEEEWEDEF